MVYYIQSLFIGLIKFHYFLVALSLIVGSYYFMWNYKTLYLFFGGSLIAFILTKTNLLKYKGIEQQTN